MLYCFSLLVSFNRHKKVCSRPKTLNTGFETSATTMHFALYELSVNPDIQDKVRKEINTVLENHHGELTYEALMEMTYLRQVLDGIFDLYNSFFG